MTLNIDAELFHENAIPEEAIKLNSRIIEELSAAKDMWQFTAKDIRRLRQEGRGPFPAQELDAAAETITIDGLHGPIDLRILKPQSRSAKGTYLHIHGGGWMLGSIDGQDIKMREIAESCGLTTISVEYRLSPEHPYPQGPDDCISAAEWLIDGTDHDFGRNFLAMGGESAGAHLAALTLLHLRDQREIMPFHAANLVAGCYDCGMSPSVRNWGSEKLILCTRDIEMFCLNFLQNGEDPRDPAVSPLYADLHDLPPALFSIGTRDLLLDDSLMMAARWHRAGSNAELAIFPGGCHVFQSFDTRQARDSLTQMEQFLNKQSEIFSAKLQALR